MVDYYYAKRANIALLDEQITALTWSAGRGFVGSAWLDPSITPEAGKSLRCSFGRALTTAQETELGTVVTNHDASQLTDEQQAAQDAAAADAAELARIDALGVACRDATASAADVRELAGLLEKRLFP